MRYDTIVIGGGVMGAAAAWSLGRRGQRVALLERFTRGHDHGSSHGDGRIIRYSYAEAVYAEMAGAAFEGWRALEQATRTRLLETTGGLDLAPEDSAIVGELSATFERLDLPHERLDPAALQTRFPNMVLAPGGVALYQPDAGVVRADRAVRAFWQAAEAHGVEIAERRAVVAIEAGDDGVGVRTEDGGTWRADHVVLCVGAWSRPWLAELGVDLPLRVTQERLLYLPPVDGALPHGIGHLPTVIDYHDTVEHFYSLPQIDVPGVKVGRHRSGPTIEADDPRVDTPRLRADILAWAGERYPQLGAEPIADVTCLYTNTPDHDFVLDRLPSEPRITIGAGFSGHGFKFAPVVGDILAASSLDAEPPVAIEPFRLGRLLV